jgi:hypothetical protein
LFADEGHGVRHAFRDQLLDVSAHRTVADEEELRAHIAADEPEHLQGEIHALDGAEVGHVDHHRVAAIGGAVSSAPLARTPAPFGAVEKIRDHVDVPSDAQRFGRVRLGLFETAVTPSD